VTKFRVLFHLANFFSSHNCFFLNLLLVWLLLNLLQLIEILSNFLGIALFSEMAKLGRQWSCLMAVLICQPICMTVLSSQLILPAVLTMQLILLPTCEAKQWTFDTGPKFNTR
jgi:hypothetical protein